MENTYQNAEIGGKGLNKQSIREYFSRKKYLYMSIIIIFLVEIIPVFFERSMTVDSSEYNVIAIGAGLAGLDWRATINTNYYYGYLTSLVYALVFLIRPLIQKPVLLFQLLLCINVLINVIASVFLYKILLLINNKRYHEKWIGILCIASSLLLSKVLLSKMATNENMYILFYYVAIYYFLKCTVSSKKNSLYSCAVAVGVMGAYATNNRGIILLIMFICVEILFRFWRKRKILSIPHFLGVFLLIFGIHLLLKDYIVNNFFLSATGGELINNNSNQIIGNLLKLASIDGIKMILVLFVGWTYYFIVSTYGLGIIVLTVMVYICLEFIFTNKKSQEKYSDIEVAVSFLGVLFFIGAVLLGATFYFNSLSDMYYNLDTVIGTNRVDKLIYGRYISTIKPLIVAAGILIMCRKKERESLRSPMVVSLLIMLACFISFNIHLVPRMINKRYATTDIYEIAVFLRNFTDNPKFGLVTANAFNRITGIYLLIVLGFFVLILIRKYKLVSVCMIGCNIALYILAIMLCIVPKSEYYYNLSNSGVKLVDDDLKNLTHTIYATKNAYLYQFGLGDYQVLNGVPEVADEAIIFSESGENYSSELRNQDYMIAPLDNNEYIYVKGDRMIEYIREKGVILGTFDPAQKSIELDRMGSENSNPEAIEVLQSDGTSGYLCYGPYLSLNKGLYEVSIDIQVMDSEMENIAHFDITYNHGDNLVLQDDITMSDVGSGYKGTIKKSFYISDVQNLEFRVYVYDDVILRINSITYQQLGE